MINKLILIRKNIHKWIRSFKPIFKDKSKEEILIENLYIGKIHASWCALDMIECIASVNSEHRKRLVENNVMPLLDDQTRLWIISEAKSFFKFDQSFIQEQKYKHLFINLKNPTIKIHYAFCTVEYKKILENYKENND